MQRPAAIVLIPVLLMITLPAAAGADGRLRVEEGRLVNQRGEPLQLRGMSSHGLQWYPEYANAGAMQYIRERGGSLFRAAMYADSSGGGYTESPEHARRNRAVLDIAVENALATDLYVIVDWHLLEDQNPLRHLDGAVEFFADIAERHKDEPAVLYEICNEPNGGTTWEDIRRYAERVIPAIREHSPDAVILVGTPAYSTDIRAPLRDPLPFENILYSFHYYAGPADEGRTAALREAVEAGLPVFVTEWGIGSGGKGEAGEEDLHKARNFLRYLGENNISWANWSLCNKDESYSALRPEVRRLSGWTESDLTPSGRLVFGALRAPPAP